MRHLHAGLLPAVLALAGLLGSTRSCQAQGIWSGEIDRAFAPGAYVPFDGAGFSHRYHYSTGPVFFLNADSRRLTTLDYLDRLDRAERFGYRRPLPPRSWNCPPPRPAVQIYGGVIVR